ncbi:uncharacterized protein LOC126895986 [Daktulosphaira vitifoliae]|uniref:uncharacterized protein LOC126895986 n=1 Tax=Daktulosphaira vitifoliae TaxID=58002 RepID=UPI0021AA8CDD|nr:uncharacterized protein LOC126895986 [Daktulosphaira vitifoliae]
MIQLKNPTTLLAKITAINEPFASIEEIARSLVYDSIHGPFDKSIKVKDNELILHGKSIRVFHECKPENIKWKDTDVNYILDASGQFSTVELAMKHITAGAKKVIITTPSRNAPIFVKGVNFFNYRKSMKIVSCASCTTNCAAPIIKIIHDKFCVHNCLLTSVHSMTTSQTIQDDTTKIRSGPGNFIPSTTGAGKAVGILIPELQGKIHGDAVRVPIMNVSLLKLFINVKKEMTLDDVKKEIMEQAKSKMKGIVHYNDDYCVSSDFIGCEHSAVVDMNYMNAINKLILINAWYDNEKGYAKRVLDLLSYMIEKDAINGVEQHEQNVC